MDALFLILDSDPASRLGVPDLSISHASVSVYIHAIERWLSDQDILVQPASAIDTMKRPRRWEAGAGGGGGVRPYAYMCLAP